MRAFVSSLVAIVAFAGGASAGVASDEVIGVWRTQLLSEVTILPCEQGYCGSLSKIVIPDGLLSAEEAEAAAAMTPDQFYDERNKDPSLRSRPMLGLQILTLRPNDKPYVLDGEIYNPEDGNTYSGYVEVLSADRIKLNGCVLFNTICRGEEWVRVPDSEAGAASTTGSL